LFGSFWWGFSEHETNKSDLWLWITPDCPFKERFRHHFLLNVPIEPCFNSKATRSKRQPWLLSEDAYIGFCICLPLFTKSGFGE
jgi:hypothetical protein